MYQARIDFAAMSKENATRAENEANSQDGSTSEGEHGAGIRTPVVSKKTISAAKSATAKAVMESENEEEEDEDEEKDDDSSDVSTDCQDAVAAGGANYKRRRNNGVTSSSSQKQSWNKSAANKKQRRGQSTLLHSHGSTEHMTPTFSERNSTSHHYSKHTAASRQKQYAKSQYVGHTAKDSRRGGSGHGSGSGHHSGSGMPHPDRSSSSIGSASRNARKNAFTFLPSTPIPVHSDTEDDDTNDGDDGNKGIQLDDKEESDGSSTAAEDAGDHDRKGD